MILSAEASIGPWPDCPSFKGLLERAAARVPIGAILADAGFDSEANHVLAHGLGIRSIMPPTIGRERACGPKGRHRHKLWSRFPLERYRQRAHIEGTYSQDKRRFGSQFRATSPRGQWGELLLRALVHNVALLLRACLNRPRIPMSSTEPRGADCG
jgi:hypothetical protein